MNGTTGSKVTRIQYQNVTVRASDEAEAAALALVKAATEPRLADKRGIAGPWRVTKVAQMVAPKGFESLFPDLTGVYEVDIDRDLHA